jgi:hypothetical protein
MTRLLLIALAVTMAACQTASAGWPDDVWDSNKPKPASRLHKKPVVKSWAKSLPKPSAHTPGPLDNAPQCQAAFRTVGDQAVTLAGAKEAAEKAFQQQARFTWGERFADVSNARDVTFECVRSSIGSVAGQVFQRCEIRARPCVAAPQAASK